MPPRTKAPLSNNVPVVVLCGGLGTRLRGTESLPKPLIEVGGRPLLWHITSLFLAQGFRRFILCTGYRGELIRQWATAWQDEIGRQEVVIECLDTGLETPTGGRIAAASESLGDAASFLVTYGDGVADIALPDLLAFHRRHGRTATVTAVRPRLPFGLLRLEGQRVTGFEEKPLLRDWINGGFFVFQRAILPELHPESVLEREPLQSLAAGGELMAYQHRGFWACMDTYKDQLELDRLWASGHAPWKTWPE
jgi:glucose-1-phosphate cytidylyltransferase